MLNLPSTTAEAVCLMRAAERRRSREERIVNDPYALLFLSAISTAAFGIHPEDVEHFSNCLASTSISCGSPGKWRSTSYQTGAASIPLSM
ncbi:MAG: hypothetical protein HN348_05860 [Proteobacteria bacterium]|jgi:O-methyltransferase involved in polyketide biosynthesis|nr:hypothetical protein [Pseudomonadota bacterium]